ncbi:cadmium-translocating P-type ATPase [Veillonella atypica]|uniref:heavy metal translocating P-type ATPase n=1 Tax=Veillonella TaxID=29465 RepID=UPI0009E103A9|nr:MULTISPECIES: heavy metal translocating P-type ATPase [Veillonella]ARG00043.1 cadmium-translocating P-type ATPase [Veillonella atypica]MBS7011867.1 cadmium-translocating P-type ATPase [Veillonella sp.]MDU6735712.1 heavy metal translocating P-type ATPase [Veillonella sp.]
MEETLLLKNLNCPNCGAKIEDRIRKMDVVETANFTLATHQLKLTGSWEDREALKRDIQDICDAIEEGVTVADYERKSKAAVDDGRENNQDNDSVTIAVIVVGLLFMIYDALTSFVPSIGLPESIETPIYYVAYVLLAFPVLRTAARNILKGEIFDENFLMSIATLGAIAIDALPEAVGVILFYRIGEFFEEKATDRSRTEIMNAVDMRPQEVRVVDTCGGGEIVVMSPEKVEVGWTIEVRPGDLIPLDGTILEGETRVNTAPVTGEPVPVRAEPGTQLMSGCINETGRITMRVDKVLEESMVTKILDAVENAAASKPKIDKFITRFARVYTPIVVALALAVAIIPSLITGEWHRWIYTALTFLVISCPCALVLSVPLAFFSGIGNASKHGILLKGGRVIEALANVKAVALDKTGTITSGEFKVHNVETVGSHVSSGQLLSMAAAIEAVSTHPIATSIVSEAKNQGLTVEPSDFVQELAGEGMVGMADGQQVLVGNRRLMERYDVQGYPTEPAEYGTEVLVAEGNTYLGRIIIADEARPDSAEAIADLNRQDIKTVMLTGDAEASANYIAKETGVSAVRAQLLPQDKLSVVQDIRSEYGPTMFVGDGINDAPVLAGADVGGAMGSGADAAIEAADVVFMRPSLTAIAHILDLSKSTLRVAWQNVVFAIAVKILIMLLGILGYASMWWAVFGDTGVSILCILNSVRILSRK